MRPARHAALHAPQWGGFADRAAAGHELARSVRDAFDDDALDGAVVLGMPRGGVPVAAIVAVALQLPLSVVLVRKLGAPQQPEYGIGAVTEDGVPFVDDEACRETGVDLATLSALVERELTVIAARKRVYLGDHDWRPPLLDRHAIVVDDGLATGVSAVAVAAFLRRAGVRRATLAVPVCAGESLHRARRVYDDVLCAQAPEPLYAVSMWYDEFEPVDDAAVATLLRRSRRLSAVDTGDKPG